jgi:hypothetical protein
MESFNTPQLIREREAWYRAGASAMNMYSAICVLVVVSIVGVAAWLFGIGTYEMLVLVVVGTWTGMATIELYIRVTARRIASRGGVDVDRF